MSAPPPPGPYDPNQGWPVPPPGQQPWTQPGQSLPGQYGPPPPGGPQPPGQQPSAGPPPQPGTGPGAGQPPGQFPPGRFPPGHVPPGGPAGPGGAPPGRPRKGLFIGGAIGAAVLLIAMVGVVVYMVADSRAYASVPESCDEIFPEDVFTEVADGRRIDITGEYDDSGDMHEYGNLDCSILFDEPENSLDHFVTIQGEIHEPETEEFEEQLEEMQEGLEDLEAELPPGEPGTVDDDLLALGPAEEEIVWQQISPGDTGVLVSFLTSGSGSGSGAPQISTAVYRDINAFVAVTVSTPAESFEWEDTADMTESLVKDVSRAFSGAAERR